MYPVHPYRLATAMAAGDRQRTGIATLKSSSYPTNGDGWQQGVMNVAVRVVCNLCQSYSARALTVGIFPALVGQLSAVDVDLFRFPKQG
jgi:hypothetical protein